jgi:hypothetical protein
MREAALRDVFEKFRGHCHFCGDEIEIGKRGWAPDLTGRWEADHVIQRRKGGSNNPDNFLPACTRCNRLRWGRSGSSLRRVLFLGLVAKYAAYHYHESTIGAQLRSMRIQRLGENWHRRMQKELARQKKELSKQEFRARAARLKTRKASLMKDLSALEGRALEILRERPGKKWDDALKKVKKDPTTPPAWLRAERALGE